ncbi:hypothetical protein FY528_10905 [Hymenobacter lutimineralis]|uniref:Uncharacterized protein n=1 Tax=Hymenobacter lutimineralis TaxID=2606448 RepID=A0A5D6V1T1_9BACT|nr:hypothetical protein [Hymenobacter lutimineralis]TYZ09247.1 hypothetical protein FY528_10905 [Hymenobacter lutimineralis]
MHRSFSSYIVVAALLAGTPALAQQKAAPAKPKPVATAAPADTARKAATGADWNAAGGGGSTQSMNQTEGIQIAPGFTAAPSMRVSTDYQGRPLGKYVRRRVSAPDPVAAPAPAYVEATPVPAPEPTPAAEPAPAAATASTSSTKKATTTATAKKAATPAKKAPAKKKADDGWGSGGSGW